MRCDAAAALKYIYPSLFLLEENRYVSNHSCLELLENGTIFSWSLKVSGAFHDWKLELVDSLLDLLRSHLSME